MDIKLMFYIVLNNEPNMDIFVNIFPAGHHSPSHLQCTT